MIGDAFSKLFDALWSVAEWVINGIASFFQSIIDLIMGFFEAILAVIAGLLYLLYMIGVLAVKLFQVIFETGKILWTLVEGFASTLASLNYTTRTTGGNGYSEIIGRLFEKLEPLNLEPIAYILLFSLWFTTAVAAIKLISSIRVGGS